MLYYWFMSDMTNPGKRNADTNPFKADFSDIEAAFNCDHINDAFGTVILFNSSSRIVADKA